MQNGRYTTMDSMTRTIRTNTFHWKRKPAACRRGSFDTRRGSPAVRVPLGHNVSREPGRARPIASNANKGRMMTKPARITYFNHISTRCPGRFFRFVKIRFNKDFRSVERDRNNGILYNKSWINPNGQSQPQTKRPNTEPKSKRKPTT